MFENSNNNKEVANVSGSGQGSPLHNNASAELQRQHAQTPHQGQPNADMQKHPYLQQQQSLAAQRPIPMRGHTPRQRPTPHQRSVTQPTQPQNVHKDQRIVQQRQAGQQRPSAHQQSAIHKHPSQTRMGASHLQKPAVAPGEKARLVVQREASNESGGSGRSSQFRSYDIKSGGWVVEPTAFQLPDVPEAIVDEDELDFELDFDFDSVCKDIPGDFPVRLRREKRSGISGGILYAVFVICLSIILGSVAWMGASDVLGFGVEPELVSVTVPRDFTIDDIVELLYGEGLIRFRSLFRLYADYSGAVYTITPGSYFLCRSFDYRALVYGMTRRVGMREERTVTIPEHFTIAQIFSRLEDNGITPAEELWHAATYHNFNFHFLCESTLGDRLRLEGFLFPDTYNFFLESTPVEALSRMLRNFNRQFDVDMVERAEEMGYTVREIVIIASMIEREAGSDEERSRIAAVIYNRLNNWDHPILQIDATLWYAIADTDQPFSVDIDSPFNTYIHPGLPPGPIANPGRASIMAALFPDTTNEFFYALNLEGTHNFFRTYAEHRAFVESDQFGG